MTGAYHVLMVCTGNVCRSPLAEHLLAAQLSQESRVRVESAGTRALVGEPMFEVTSYLARGRGLENIEGHRARQVTPGMVDAADLILTMSREHRRGVVELNPRATRRAFTIREFARLVEATPAEVLTGSPGLAEREGIERLKETVKTLSVGRSLVGPLVDPMDDDVVDPYLREREVHEESLAQLAPAVESAGSFLARWLKGGA